MCERAWERGGTKFSNFNGRGEVARKSGGGEGGGEYVRARGKPPTREKGRGGRREGGREGVRTLSREEQRGRSSFVVGGLLSLNRVRLASERRWNSLSLSGFWWRPRSRGRRARGASDASASRWFCAAVGTETWHRLFGRTTQLNECV